jgi:hypothetical protein
MSFSKKISEDVLIASGCHCCLCHKFCGTKIELHHIKQKADGGEDSFENCIALCFDCHAEVKAYNPKHPKGKKYTEKELKRHRDNWYEKVKNNNGVKVNPEYKEMDKKVYIEIKKLLFDSGSMKFIKENNFAGFSFDTRKLRPLDEFEDRCKNPEFEFLDVDLEGLRLKLLENIQLLSELIVTNTWPVKGNSQRNTVPPEWEYKQPERFKKVIGEIHNLCSEIWDTYCELVKLGRRKLGE